MDFKDSKILCIFAHPDDESYIVGGTVARAAAEGAEITVISATMGDRGFQHVSNLEEKAHLSRIRAEELKNAAAILGVKEVILWDYPDGGLDALGEREQELQDKLIKEIGRVKSSIILTFGPDGVSGHRDHIAIGNIVRNLLTSQTFNFIISVYGVTMPREFIPFFQKMLFARLKTREHYNTNNHLDAPALSEVEKVDISAFAEKKFAAMRAHGSQNPEGLIRAAQVLPKHFWQNEYFLPLFSQ